MFEAAKDPPLGSARDRDQSRTRSSRFSRSAPSCIDSYSSCIESSSCVAPSGGESVKVGDATGSSGLATVCGVSSCSGSVGALDPPRAGDTVLSKSDGASLDGVRIAAAREMVGESARAFRSARPPWSALPTPPVPLTASRLENASEVKTYGVVFRRWRRFQGPP